MYPSINAINNERYRKVISDLKKLTGNAIITNKDIGYAIKVMRVKCLLGMLIKEPTHRLTELIIEVKHSNTSPLFRKLVKRLVMGKNCNLDIHLSKFAKAGNVLWQDFPVNSLRVGITKAQIKWIEDNVDMPKEMKEVLDAKANS